MGSASRVSQGRQLGVLFGSGTLCGLTDGQLLTRFTNGTPEAAEAAFSVLVDRHGGMVLRVCRGVLENTDDANDAFQATFFVLARRARSVRRPESVGSWLHGVAHRISARARVDAARRRTHERQRCELLASQTAGADADAVDPSLHEEINRLPEKYRAPIVLCYLESLTHEEAAAHLGWPVGTVRGRLARARDLLRARLTRRGLAVAVGAVAAPALPAEAAVPLALREATVNAARAFAAAHTPAITVGIADRVRSLVSAELGTPSRVALKFALPALAVAGVAAVAGLATRAASDERPARTPTTAQPLPKPPAPNTDRTEIQGTWITSQSVNTLRAGQPLPPKDVPVVWTIDGHRIVETIGAPDDSDDVQEHIYRYVLNPAASPNAIDLSSAAYGLIKGIYRLDDDTLTISHGFPDRPAMFHDRDPQSVFLLFKRARPAARRGPVRFPNAEGCEWALFPMSLGGTSSMCMATLGGFVVSMDHDGGGPLRVSLAHPGRRAGSPAPKYVAVAFDAARRRYPLTPLGSAEGGNPNAGPTVALSQFSLDPKVLPAEKVTHVGIELVTPEARGRRPVGN